MNSVNKGETTYILAIKRIFVFSKRMQMKWLYGGDNMQQPQAKYCLGIAFTAIFKAC